MVARFGYVGIWHGKMTRAKTRADGMYERVQDYIYKEGGSDWALVAARLEEVVAQSPAKVDAGVELGNAYLRLGKREQAMAAYQRLLDQKKIPVEPLIATQLKVHIATIRSAPDPAKVTPFRNPWLE